MSQDGFSLLCSNNVMTGLMSTSFSCPALIFWDELHPWLRLIVANCRGQSRAVADLYCCWYAPVTHVYHSACKHRTSSCRVFGKEHLHFHISTVTSWCMLTDKFILLEPFYPCSVQLVLLVVENSATSEELHAWSVLSRNVLP